MSKEKPDSERIKEVLTFDPLKAAEDISGQSYKSDKVTESMGMLLHLSHVDNKRKILQSSGDTHYSIKIGEYKEIAKLLGFELLLDEPFVNSEGITEHLYMYWHPEGVFLRVETYTWKHDDQNPGINTAEIFFNFHFGSHENHDKWYRKSLSCSGHYSQEHDAWVGYKDVREGLKYFMETARECGNFMSKWFEIPKNWMGGNYMDWKEPNYNGYECEKTRDNPIKRSAERLAKLPIEIQKLMGLVP